MSFRFYVVADQYLKRLDKSSNTIRNYRSALDALGEKFNQLPIADIQSSDVWDAVALVEKRGHRQTAGTALRLAGRVLRYAIITKQRTASDCTVDVKGMLNTGKVRPRSAVTTREGIATVLKALSSNRGSEVTRAAQLLLAHTFVRPGELTGMRWSEIDWIQGMWVIPAERMKMRRPHAVPLSRQAVELLESIPRRHSIFVFPGARGRGLNRNTLGELMRRSGVPGSLHVPHGWRATASTIMNEWGVDSALVELQLAHAKKDRVAGVYDRSQRLEERVALMQRWSDFLDECMR
jgi:integrase